MSVPVFVLLLLLLFGACLSSVEGKPGKQSLRGDINALGETLDVTSSEAKMDFMGTSWVSGSNQSFIVFDPSVKNVLSVVTFIDNLFYQCKPMIYDFRRKYSLLMLYGDFGDNYKVINVKTYRVSLSESTMILINATMHQTTYQKVNHVPISMSCAMAIMPSYTFLNMSYFSGVNDHFDLKKYVIMNSPQGLIMARNGQYMEVHAGKTFPIALINQSTVSIISNIQITGPNSNAFKYPVFYDGTELWFTGGNDFEIVSSSGRKVDVRIFGLPSKNNIRDAASNDGNTFYFTANAADPQAWSTNRLIKATIQPFQVQEIEPVTSQSSFEHISLDLTGRYLFAIVGTQEFAGQYVNVYNTETMVLVRTVELPNTHAYTYTSLTQTEYGIFLTSIEIDYNSRKLQVGKIDISQFI